MENIFFLMGGGQSVVTPHMNTPLIRTTYRPWVGAVPVQSNQTDYCRRALKRRLRLEAVWGVGFHENYYFISPRNEISQLLCENLPTFPEIFSPFHLARITKFRHFVNPY